MSRQPLSTVVTTLNNADTLERCLESVAWADDIVVLDSGSSDTTRIIAESRGARFFTQPFAGYSRQKQAAIDLALHDWVLLLDSDEAVVAEHVARLCEALQHPACAGFELWRREWLFWRWQSRHSRLNHYVRLFDRRRARMNGLIVHESVEVSGPVLPLNVMIDHYGERDIAGRVDKANHYSSLQVVDLRQRSLRGLRLRMLCYPWVAFVRYYFLRGHWREGWAGLVAARVHAFYAFMKYAKLFEAQLHEQDEPPSTGSGTAQTGGGSARG